MRSLVLMAPFNQPRDISVFAWPGVGEWALRSFYLPPMAKSQGEAPALILSTRLRDTTSKKTPVRGLVLTTHPGWPYQ